MTGSKDFIFSMTTGRSGSHYLAEVLRLNLPDAESHCELIGWDRFGVDTPDLSHMTLFNSQGNVEKVQAFWRQKLARVATTERRFYAESSHLLMKAGLIENFQPLCDVGRVHLIALERDPVEIMLSLRSRGDFLNYGNIWLWYLDPRYPKNLVNSDALTKHGMNGAILWYILEVRTRAAFYEQLLADRADVAVHRFTLSELGGKEGVGRLVRCLGLAAPPGDPVVPAAQNVGLGNKPFPPAERATIEQLVASVRFDPHAIAQEAIRRGVRF